jgi:hypothetical protein
MGKGKAVAGLILSIVAIIFSFLGTFFSIAALPMAIVGLVLSVSGRRKLIENKQPAGVGTAGLVLGIIAVVLSAIFFFTCGICTLCAAGTVMSGL